MMTTTTTPTDEEVYRSIYNEEIKLPHGGKHHSFHGLVDLSHKERMEAEILSLQNKDLPDHYLDVWMVVHHVARHRHFLKSKHSSAKLLEDYKHQSYIKVMKRIYGQVSFLLCGLLSELDQHRALRVGAQENWGLKKTQEVVVVSPPAPLSLPPVGPVLQTAVEEVPEVVVTQKPKKLKKKPEEEQPKKKEPVVLTQEEQDLLLDL